MNFILPPQLHDQIITAAYLSKGFDAEETKLAVQACRNAAEHGIKTHNALKALHLDELFGSGHADNPGCVPGAILQKISTPFQATQKWDAQKKLGQAVAYQAMDACIEMADKYGVGIVSVDQAFHYLWGGGYVMRAAEQGYIAYTNCTSSLAEVVPFTGKYPTLGTNPHSWGLPTTQAIGYPIVIDWATSTVAMGRVQQLKREGLSLPADAAVDVAGNPTTDPNKVSALLPFGKHKGYGLSLINEVLGAMIGGSLPTFRSRPEVAPKDEKITCNFFFQVIHPDAISSGAFAKSRNQNQNVQAVIEDILGHGNEGCILPGQIEHQASIRTKEAGGLIFTKSEIQEFQTLAETHQINLDIETLKTC